MKSVRYLSTFLLLSLAVSVWGQAADAGAAAATNPADQLPRAMAYVLVIAGAALFIVAMIYVVNVNQFLYKRVLNLEAAKSGVSLPEAPDVQPQPEADSFLTTLRKKYWEDPVPIDREEEILLNHGFDGIRELDNRLPPWWVNLFVLSILWAAVYMYYYHWGGNGPSSTEEYKMEIEQAKKDQVIAAAGKSESIDEFNVTALTESGDLSEGELIYKNTCAACHGQKGEGTVGPNMTDEYWIHGGGIKNIFKTIKYGVPDKGMISWVSQLKPGDMQKVGSYILTLQGTNPPNPKAPQGIIWKEEAAVADTTATTPQ